MWLTFGLAILACLAFLYVPGFLFSRALGMRTFSSLLSAPLVSVTAYCLFGLALTKVGILCTWSSVAIPIIAICCFIYILRIVKEGFGDDSLGNGRIPLLVLYCGVGAALGLFYFLLALDSPLSIVKEYDNCFHVDVIRAFLDSGSWSFLDVGPYLTEADLLIAPTASSGFYPVAWHITCALVASFTGCEPALAENAVNFASCFIVFPASMLFFFTKVFEDRRVILVGSVCIFAFVAFPWALLIWGPVFSNVFSLTLAPAAASIFICFVEALVAHKKRATYCTVLLIAMLALALSQPNTLFFCIFLLAPYATYRIWTLGHAVKVGNAHVDNRLLSVLFVAFVIVACVAFAYSPFMPNFSSTENWTVTKTAGDALVDIASLSFAWYNAQPVLAVLLLVGFVYTLSKRRYLWITVAYLVFCLVYFAGVALEGLPKALLAGFWYSDGYRIAACRAIVGSLLVALGLNAIVGLLHKALSNKPAIWKISSAFVIAVFCIATYCPQLIISEEKPSTPFNQYFAFMTHENYSLSKSIYEIDEEHFVEQVKGIVPEDELVVNVPGDGSAFSYGLDGLRTYYRSFRGYNGADTASAQEGGETRASRIIREGAANIASDALVAEAFDAIGARYVLMLDVGSAYDEQPAQVTDSELFAGIMAMDEETPGFELVLSENDMRLYKRVD